MGLAQWTPGQTLDQVLAEADKEMYVAKEVRKQAK